MQRPPRDLGECPRPAINVGSAPSMRSTSRRVPIVPVEQTRTCSGAHPECSSGEATREFGREATLRACRRVRTAAVQDDPHAKTAGFCEVGTRDLHRRSRLEVRGERCCDRHRSGTLARHQREVEPPVRLDSGGCRGGHKTSWRQDRHGTRPRVGSPRVSSRPSATFAAWIACPAPPLTRLSKAASATTCPVRSS